MSTTALSSITIPPEYHGQRFDVVIAQLVPEYSRSQLSTWIQEEKITLNTKACKPKIKVNGGDVIDFAEDLTTPLKNAPLQWEPENIPLDIIFEDEHLLVLNKPAGLVVHPGAGNYEHTLVNALLYHVPSSNALPRAGIVHRLDKETTGLMVVAKTLQSQTNLTRQIQERSIQRRYVTLVQGHIISGGEIDTFYGRHARNRLKMAVHKQGTRQAITRFSLRKQYHDFTLLDVQLFTGRTHQIRVHMAHINHPVVGDPLYGGRMRYPREASIELRTLLQTFKRQALHAIALSFEHPENGSLLEFSAPIPDDFQKIIDALDAHYQ